MSRRNKLEKFNELLTFQNVYQNYDFLNPDMVGLNGRSMDLRGQWATKHFRNEGPVTLELACGGGEYTLGLAALYPDENFIGVDIKGNRIWKGARKALSQKLSNAAFLRTRIEQIDLFFDENEISQIWITFPDPFPRKSKKNRRLTNSNFLERYKKILKPGGLLHLKTDATALFEFSCELWEEDPAWQVEEICEDVYADDTPSPELAITSFYEQSHLAEGRTIHYVRCHLLADPSILTH